MEKPLSKLHIWLLAIRPKTLPASVPPVVVGSAVAALDGVFAIVPAAAAFLGVLFLQVAVNLANDYFDAKNNIDSEERLGPVRVTQSGLIPPGQVRGAMVLCLAAAGAVFVYLSMVGGWVFFGIGVVSIIAALGYSGGPYPLASHGLGELFSFLFFGLVAVCGTYYLQAGLFSWRAVSASIAPGLLISAIMVVNNFRDIETDSKTGKRTLAVRLGKGNTIRLYRTLLVLPFLVPVQFLAADWCGGMVLLTLVTVPMVFSLWQEIGRVEGRQLNTTLARTAQLSLIFSLLFSLGILL